GRQGWRTQGVQGGTVGCQRSGARAQDSRHRARSGARGAGCRRRGKGPIVVGTAVAAPGRAPRAALRLGTLALLAALIVACSKDKNVEQPAKLTPLNATLRVQRVWSAAVDDKKAAVLRLGLGLSVAGNRVFAAGHRGDVVAFDLASGRSLWRAR